MKAKLELILRLINEQQRFVGYKITCLQLVILDPITHVLRVYQMTSIKTVLEKRVSMELITMMVL